MIPARPHIPPGPWLSSPLTPPPSPLGYSPGVTEQPASPPRASDLDAPTGPTDPVPTEHEGAAPQPPRRQPGDPHPYMLQRNPPNLWILVALTVFSLALTVLILALTVLL